MVNKCCRRRKAADASKETEVTTVVDKDGEIEQLLKLKQAELREICMQKGLAISGNKSELASRIASWKPQANRPTATQLKQLHELEINRRSTFGAIAYTDSALCKRAIAELSKLPKFCELSHGL